MIGRKLLDRYEITRELGRGGLGVVYQANDRLLKRPVAIKMLSHTGVEDTGGRGRLLHEAQAAAILDHPNIVAVYDVVEEDKTAYLVMQLVEGQTLKAQKPESLDAALTAALQISSALDFAHRQGIIHRDIKPANVMISKDDSVKLMDFGLARSVSSQLTFEGELAGTMDYISPEQILGVPVSGQTDIYSFGVMLYELTTGRLPFIAESPVSLLSQHLHAPVVPPAARNGSIPPALSDLIVEMMSKSPADRPESAHLVGQRLRTIRDMVTDPSSELVETQVETLDRIVRGRLIGRQREFSDVQSSWREAAAGNGQTVLISGEPGIGKSRLLQELITQVEASGDFTLFGASYEEDQSPYGSIAQVIEDLIKSISETDISLPEYIVADLIEFVPALRKSYPNISPSKTLDPKSSQGRLTADIDDLLRALCQRRPVLIVIDDAHWADSGSSQVFLNLARRLRGQKVMLVAAYRETDIEYTSPFFDVVNDLNRERLVKRIKISRLDQASTMVLLESLFEEEITSEFLEGIYLETEGNPFFIEEVCRSLIESGDLYFEDGQWHRPSIEEMKIPPSVKAAIQSRVRHLPDGVQDSLRLAAIFGRSVPFDLLLAASQVGEDALIEHIEAASKAQIMREVGQNGQILLEFVHGLIPATLIEDMLALKKRRLHMRAAEVIERASSDDVESLAYHYQLANNDGKALKYLLASAYRADSAGANKEAIRFFTAALEYEPAPDIKAELLDRLGGVYSRQGSFEKARAVWGEAEILYSASGKEDEIARLYAGMLNAYWGEGERGQAQEFGMEKVQIVQEFKDSPGMAVFYHELARILAFNNLTAEASDYAAQALKMAQLMGPVEAEIDSLITLALVEGQYGDNNLSMLDTAVALARENELPNQESRALNNRAVSLYLNPGDIIGAFNDYERAVQLAHSIGDLFQEQFYLGGYIFVARYLGKYALAKESMVTLGEMLDSTRDPGPLLFRYHLLEAELNYETGQIEEALTQAYDLYEKAVANNNRTYRVYTKLIIAKILMQKGEYKQAVEEMEQIIQDAGGVENYSEHELNGELIAAYSMIDDLAKAQDLVTHADIRLVESGMPRFNSALVTRGKAQFEAACSRWDECWDLFADALSQFEGMSLPWLAAKTKQEWGEAHQLRGTGEDTVLARKLFNEAAADFEALGISIRAEECRRAAAKMTPAASAAADPPGDEQAPT